MSSVFPLMRLKGSLQWFRWSAVCLMPFLCQAMYYGMSLVQCGINSAQNFISLQKVGTELIVLDDSLWRIL